MPERGMQGYGRARAEGGDGVCEGRTGAVRGALPVQRGAPPGSAPWAVRAGLHRAHRRGGRAPAERHRGVKWQSAEYGLS